MKKHLLNLLFVFVVAGVFLSGCKGEIELSEKKTQYSEDIVKTLDGNAVVVGTTSNTDGNYYDFNILKVDPYGSVIWKKSFGGENLDRAEACTETDDGSIVVAGNTESFQSENTEQSDKKNIWILKFDTNGNQIWSRVYGGPQADGVYDIEKTSDGGYIVLGYTHTFDDQGIKAWKLNSQGDLEWSTTYSQGLVGKAIEETSDGGFFICGNTRPGEDTSDLVVIKTNHQGEVEWNQNLGGDQRDEIATDIHQTADNGFIVSGYKHDVLVNGEREDADAWFIKLNEDGYISWEKTYGGDKYDIPNSIAETGDGSFVFVGKTYSYSSGSNSDQWVGKLDSSGGKVWFKTYGKDGGDSLKDVELLDGGDILACGHTYTSITNGADISILRLNSNGETE